VLFEEQAQKVLATLADTSAATLFAFAEGLTNEPASHFSLAINYLAGKREPGEQPHRLTAMNSSYFHVTEFRSAERIVASDQLGDGWRASYAPAISTLSRPQDASEIRLRHAYGPAT
jgi:hypothetical protein